MMQLSMTTKLEMARLVPEAAQLLHGPSFWEGFCLIQVRGYAKIITVWDRRRAPHDAAGAKVASIPVEDLNAENGEQRGCQV